MSARGAHDRTPTRSPAARPAAGLSAARARSGCPAPAARRPAPASSTDRTSAGCSIGISYSSSNAMPWLAQNSFFRDLELWDQDPLPFLTPVPHLFLPQSAQPNPNPNASVPTPFTHPHCSSTASPYASPHVHFRTCICKQASCAGQAAKATSRAAATQLVPSLHAALCGCGRSGGAGAASGGRRALGHTTHGGGARCRRRHGLPSGGGSGGSQRRGTFALVLVLACRRRRGGRTEEWAGGSGGRPRSKQGQRGSRTVMVHRRSTGSGACCKSAGPGGKVQWRWALALAPSLLRQRRRQRRRGAGSGRLHPCCWALAMAA